MCGIGGIFRREAQRRPDARVDRLRDALRHRGPEDEGIWSSAEGTATLVHTRLCILDPRPVGHQPMNRGDLWITFNGEIYNFRELRMEMEAEGEVFGTQTDTEVLLALYRRHGSAFLRFLRGMFALAIWDERSRSGFLARDRFGIKPLYYGTTKSGDFLFASELQALLGTNAFDRKIDPAALESYLISGSVAEPLTLISGLSCLGAGHFLEWGDGGVKMDSYYDVGGSRPRVEDDAVDLTRQALRDSVRHHLISDVPVAVFLSGGLDSGAVVSLAREAGSEPVATFTLGVEAGKLDESQAALSRAAAMDTRHHELLLTRELAENWMPAFLDALDQPSIDGFNTYGVAKLAAAHGFRVVLSGIGGDELFGGYPSFASVPRLRGAGRMLGRFRPTFAMGTRRAFGSFGKANRIACFLEGAPTLSRAYDAVRSVFCPTEARLLAQHFSGSAVESESDAELVESESASDPREEVSRLELTRYLRNQLLRDADVMGMAHGVEIRTPFVDHLLLEKLQGVPAGIRFAAGKKLLRRALPEISQIGIHKHGFALPFEDWLENPACTWSHLPTSLLNLVPLDTWARKWSLVILAAWMKRHLGWEMK